MNAGMKLKKIETDKKQYLDLLLLADDRHHLVKNFFTDHYDHPIYECGVQLVDMVYLQKEI